jgi:hypothetical protein
MFSMSDSSPTQQLILSTQMAEGPNEHKAMDYLGLLPDGK